MYTFFEKLTKDFSEADLFAWATSMIGNSFEQSFDDITDGIYFIKLVEAISGPESVDWASIDMDDKEQNAQ